MDDLGLGKKRVDFCPAFDSQILTAIQSRSAWNINSIIDDFVAVCTSEVLLILWCVTDFSTSAVKFQSVEKTLRDRERQVLADDMHMQFLYLILNGSLFAGVSCPSGFVCSDDSVLVYCL